MTSVLFFWTQRLLTWRHRLPPTHFAVIPEETPGKTSSTGFVFAYVRLSHFSLSILSKHRNTDQFGCTLQYPYILNGLFSSVLSVQDICFLLGKVGGMGVMSKQKLGHLCGCLWCLEMHFYPFLNGRKLLSIKIYWVCVLIFWIWSQCETLAMFFASCSVVLKIMLLNFFINIYTFFNASLNKSHFL